MHIILGTVFIASLLGSLHCVGMCGPFALLAGASDGNQKSSHLPTVAYSFGRLVSYSIVGALFGAMGMAINASAAVTSWQQSATYVAGMLMIVVGAIALVRCCGFQFPLPKFFSPLQKWLQAGFSKTKKLPTTQRALAIGILTSLMPCGWLYSFAITAAGTASPLWGAVLMAVFWAGTVPIMAALMLGFCRIGASIRQHIPVAMASLVIAVGVFTIAFRAPVVIAGENFQIKQKSHDVLQQVKDIEQHELPCCCAEAAK